MSAYYDSMRRRAAERGEPAPPAETSTALTPPPPAASTIARMAVVPVPPPPATAFGRLDPASPFAVLRERLMARGNGRALRTLVFAGCSGAEACSAFVREFARSLAQGGLRVLVLETTGAPRDDEGAVDVAAAVAGAPVVPQAFGHGTLAALGSRTAPVEKENLFRSTAFGVWLDAQREVFDYVLVAAPPVLRFADGVLVGRLTDGVILVVQAEATEKTAVARARERLDRAGVAVLGAVLDGVRDDLPAPFRRYLSED